MTDDTTAEQTDEPTSIKDAPRGYAPLNITSSRGDSDGVPVGRIRVGHDVDVPGGPVERTHIARGHLLCTGLPRRGVSTTVTTFAEELSRSHGFKIVSVMDDGRMETPMVSIPNDDETQQASLGRFDTEPAGLPTEVFVPASGTLPDVLPENVREFTIGIDELTPRMLLQLSGIDGSETAIDRQVQLALDGACEDDEPVTGLVSRLRVLGRETEATIEWAGEDTDAESSSEPTRTTHTMEASPALETAADRVIDLADAGILSGPDADTTLDVSACIEDHERAAVLCPNFLPDRYNELRYLVADLWLQLVYHAKDTDPRLPPVAVTIPELKRAAPTTLSNAHFKSAVRGLRKTVYRLVVQGLSRDVSVLAGTNNVTDVYRPIRENFTETIALQLGERDIDTLSQGHHFSAEQADALRDFDIGQGMYLSEGRAEWPVEFRPPRCGTDDGDWLWIDRFGLAWGARVRRGTHDDWHADNTDTEWWVHTLDSTVHDDRAPDDGPFYSEWYLLREDFADVLGDVPEPGDIDAELVDRVLEARREYDVPSPLAVRMHTDADS